MRAVVYQDVGKLSVDDLPEPTIEEPTDAIVRISTSAICGSDLHFYSGKAPLLPGDPLGHEGMGVIEEVGSGVDGLAVGDRVVIAFNIVCGECWFCRRGQTSLCEEFRNLGAGVIGGSLGGTQAELVRIPNATHNLLMVPEGMDDERALFVGDILTTGYYGAAIAGIEKGDTVAVVGAGPVGFFAAQSARLHDPAEVLVLDLDEERLAIVEKLGLTPLNVRDRNAATAVSEHTEGRGADVVIEAVGSVPALETSMDVVRRGGTICVIGMYVSETLELQLGVAWSRMLRFVFGGLCPVHAWWDKAMQAVADGKIDPLPIISHTLPLDEAPKGYDLFQRREATKVVLKP
ncbi:MAG TPA: alcohol dehydrogenase catalytic domain-containing protein [Actinomycetota bacterium]|nr:alcohol dehydrogenase catalytic domain-containing protein [Actinomycetota bacterium]